MIYAKYPASKTRWDIFHEAFGDCPIIHGFQEVSDGWGLFWRFIWTVMGYEDFCP